MTKKRIRRYRIVRVEPVGEQQFKVIMAPVDEDIVELVFGRRRLVRLRHKPKRLREVLRNALKGKLRKALKIRGSGAIRDGGMQKGAAQDSTRMGRQVILSDNGNHRTASRGKVTRPERRRTR